MIRSKTILLVASALIATTCCNWTIATGQEKAEVKHLFILSGQSNMAGLRPAESFTPTVEKEFGKENVIVVHDAHGGQPIRRWDKLWKSKSEQSGKQKPGDLYDRLMAKVKKATEGKKLKSVSFLWMQGERDAREKNADLYADSLKRVVSQVSKDLEHESVYVVIGRLSDFDMENKRYQHWTRIREIQVDLAKNNPKVEWVDTDDLNDGKNRRGKPIKNDLHYSAEGYKIFGTRLAEKAIKLIKEDSEPGEQPNFPVSIFQNTRLITKADELSNAKPDRQLEFKNVDGVTLKLHIFEPEKQTGTSPAPCIVFFFGGGWKGGSPSQFYTQSRYLASRGLVAFCAEYRVKTRNNTSPKECVKDGKSAIRFVRENAAKLGIDPNRIVAAGGSAGGHVAAATATIKAFEEPSDNKQISCRPNALVLFNPVYDNSEKGYGYPRVKEYWKDISPLHNLSSQMPPTIVFLGTKDNLIPVDTAKSFQEKMKELGCRSDLHLYEGQPHGFFNRGENYVDTVEKMDEFLVSLGYLEGKPTIRRLLPKGPVKANQGQKKKGNKKAKKKKQRNKQDQKDKSASFSA